MRRESDDKEKRMNKNEDPKGRGGGRLRFRKVDGDVPLRMRSCDEDHKDRSSISSSKKDNIMDAAHGSNDSSSRKEDSRSKNIQAVAKICAATLQKTIRKSKRTKEKDTTFIEQQKKQEVNSLK